MTYRFLNASDKNTIPIIPIETAVFKAWLKTQENVMKRWVKSVGFNAEAGSVSLVAGKEGVLSKVLVGVDEHHGLWAYADLPRRLSGGRFEIDARFDTKGANAAAIGWALGFYKFNRYKSKTTNTESPSLVWPENCDRSSVRRTADAIFLVRDLINMPASDMGPGELAAAARKLARKHKATVKVISGNNLLNRNYPTIHAVG